MSRSAVSRRFGALSAQQLAEWRSPPGIWDLRVVQIDGIRLNKNEVLSALGIDTLGQKQVLGLRKGTTENFTIVRALLAGPIDRGLSPDLRLLFATDGLRMPEHSGCKPVPR